MLWQVLGCGFSRLLVPKSTGVLLKNVTTDTERTYVVCCGYQYSATARGAVSAVPMRGCAPAKAVKGAVG